MLNWCNLAELKEPAPACLEQKNLLLFLFLLQNNTSKLSKKIVFESGYKVVFCTDISLFTWRNPYIGGAECLVLFKLARVILLMFQAYISNMSVTFLLCHSKLIYVMLFLHRCSFDHCLMQQYLYFLWKKILLFRTGFPMIQCSFHTVLISAIFYQSFNH